MIHHDAGGVTSHARSALVLYGSETGNAQDVALELESIARRLRFSTNLKELNSIGLAELLQYDVVLIAISTTGQGDLPQNAQVLWKKLRSVRLRAGCFADLQFSVFGLGDSSYPQFNWACRKLTNRLKQLGGQLFYDRGESDEQHPEGVDGTFLPWSNGLKEKLLGNYPLPKGIEPLSDDIFLQPKWLLATRRDGHKKAIGQRDSSSSDAEASSSLTTPDSELIFVPSGVEATVESNARLTPDTHWQDVRLLELTTQKTDYHPGDVLTIYPKNFPEDVNSFLTLMGWDHIADDELVFISNPSSEMSTSAGSPPIGAEHGVLSLRKLLTDYLDITSIPRRSFFAAIAHFTTDEMQKERLVEFTIPELVDELYDYTTRPRRSMLEVLQEFYTVKIPFEYIASIIPFMRGRQFSIASGGELKQGPDGRTRIQLLIAIVKYRTVIKKIRQGLCTRYVADLKPGSRMSVSFSKSGMKVDLARPSVMIGPGTGVAPLRSMIYERGQVSAGVSPLQLEQLLFFGGRSRQADFFFESEWTTLAGAQRLEVFPAFSRDQPTKYYVQDALREQSKAVYRVLKTGNVYVCGSSGKMPQAVREALIDVLQAEGDVTRVDAEQQFTALEKSGRYQQETW